MADRIPIREGTFEEKDGGGVLIANRCTSCGQIYFPKAGFCFDCLCQSMEDMALSREGKLYSYTIGRMPSAKFAPPHFVGMVDLPEGVRVFAPLKMSEDEPIKIGMDMTLVIEALYRENDQDVIGYKFEPLDKRQA